MEKKYLVVLFVALLCLSQVGTAHGVTYIRFWFGKYLELNQATIAPELYLMETNTNISIDLTFWSHYDLHVNSIRLELSMGIYDVMNTTLLEDFNWSNGFPLYRQVVFRPTATAPILELSLFINADYQYIEGNQTFEETDSLALENIFLVPQASYSNLTNQIGALQSENNNLNSSYQNVNARFQDQTKWTLLLSITTILFIATTVFEIARNRRSKHTSIGQP